MLLRVRVLDVGAGSGWLSHCLTALGHGAVALDAIDDDVDGLGAAQLRLQPRFVPSRGSIKWRLHRTASRIRLHRAPAAFGLWVAR